MEITNFRGKFTLETANNFKYEADVHVVDWLYSDYSFTIW